MNDAVKTPKNRNSSLHSVVFKADTMSKAAKKAPEMPLTMVQLPGKSDKPIKSYGCLNIGGEGVENLMECERNAKKRKSEREPPKINCGDPLGEYLKPLSGFLTLASDFSAGSVTEPVQGNSVGPVAKIESRATATIKNNYSQASDQNEWLDHLKKEEEDPQDISDNNNVQDATADSPGWEEGSYEGLTLDDWYFFEFREELRYAPWYYRRYYEEWGIYENEDFEGP